MKKILLRLWPQLLSVAAIAAVTYMLGLFGTPLGMAAPMLGMAISFPTIPTTLRVPAFFAEFDASRANQGPSLLAYRGLVIGQKIPTGTWTVNTFNRATNADQVATGAGRGSLLHRQALAWFEANKSTETYFGVLGDSSSGVDATGTLTFAGTATAAGTVALNVGRDRVEVAVASGDTASTVASAAATAIGKHASGTITFASAASGDNITIGATTFIATTGAVTPGAATYCYDTGNNQTAASLVAQVKAHAVASTVVRPYASSAVVTLRSIQGGTAGNSVVLTSVDGATTAVTGSGTLTGATDTEMDLPVHSSVSSAIVTLYFKNLGLAGNELDVRYNYQDGDELPAGITLSVGAMANGASNPTMTTLISALSDEWFQIWTMPYTDSTSMSAVKTELTSRFGPMRMIDGYCFVSKDDTHSNLSTLGNTHNSPHVSIVAQPGDNPVNPSYEFAAQAAALVAYYGAIDPARPFQTLAMPTMLAPAETDRYSLEERNLLLYDGVSTTRVSGDELQLERMITTYKTNAAGSADTAYLDTNTMLTLMYLRYSFKARIQTRYPRHKLANDSTRVGPGQAIITPKIGKAEAILWFREMEALGLVENFADFKTNLVVERNETDPNRLDFLLPPDLVNQFIVGAANIQFRL